MLFVAFLTKSLSEYDRQRLSLTLLCLNVIQIFVAISGFALGAYISLNVNSKAHLIRGYSLKPIGGTLSGCSIALFVFHCIGAKASNDCICLRTRHRFERKLFFIVLGYTILSAVLLSVPIVCGIQYYKLKSATSLNHRLLGTMKFYSKGRNWKRDFDEIQMEYRCCGSYNHTDWFKIKWMPETSLPSEKDRAFIRKDYLHSVPFSCCDPSSSGPCFHRLVNTRRGQYKYPNHGFFKRGCTMVLLEVVQEVITATALLIVVPFFMEVVLAVQTRYLETSLEDCRRRRNARGDGTCWLFRKSPYQADLQSQPKEDFMEDLSFFSPSEEYLIYAPNDMAYSDEHEPDRISMDSQTKLKRNVRGKEDDISSHSGNEDDDLKKLLTNQNGEISRSKNERLPEKQQNGPRENTEKNGRKY